MANVTLTALFGNLNDWPGHLLEARGDEIFLARTATAFSYRYGASHDFAGYTVTATGTAFTYLSGDPIGGTMSGLTIRNAVGQVVLTVTGLTGLASNLSQIMSDVFGSAIPDTGPGPDPIGAWSHLLSGNDTIFGTVGNDREGFPGVDVGNDTYLLGAGDDEVNGGIGNDSYNGGIGYDVLTFRSTSYNEGNAGFRGVTINVMVGTVLDCWGGTDRFTGFEGFGLSRFSDVFIGNNTQQDDITGYRGNDIIDGGANTFDLQGNQTSDRDDRVQYGDDYWQGGRFGIVANLQVAIVAGSIRGTVRDGFGNTDTLFDIERVAGTRFADAITGSSVGNVFRGYEGRDTFNGGAGFDALDFGSSTMGTDPFGVNVNLALATGQIINDGFGNIETAISFEELRGSNAADIFRGNALNNKIEGRGGSDTLSGQGGQDKFVFYEQRETAGSVDRITDFAATGLGIDTLAFQTTNWSNMSATLRLVNGTAATTAFGTFLFDAATDQLIWDANGTGLGERTIIAVLPNVAALSAANFELWT
jgi:serralysin